VTRPSLWMAEYLWTRRDTNNEETVYCGPAAGLHHSVKSSSTGSNESLAPMISSQSSADPGIAVPWPLICWRKPDSRTLTRSLMVSRVIAIPRRSLRQTQFARPRTPTTRRPASSTQSANRSGAISAPEGGLRRCLGSAGKRPSAGRIPCKRGVVGHRWDNLERKLLDEACITSMLRVMRRRRRIGGTVMDHHPLDVRIPCQENLCAV
jgi:hypothetical protein